MMKTKVSNWKIFICQKSTWTWVWSKKLIETITWSNLILITDQQLKRNWDRVILRIGSSKKYCLQSISIWIQEKTGFSSITIKYILVKSPLIIDTIVNQNLIWEAITNMRVTNISLQISTVSHCLTEKLNTFCKEKNHRDKIKWKELKLWVQIKNDNVNLIWNN